ncbi:hypothetical protein V8G54_006855 [Vigna mungo]|uniref:WHEP-TRS domain-containing protein n=1 Tax=Vigna mungo TaxID=3915 RepID=A0AAQ3S7R8_VIGMU
MAAIDDSLCKSFADKHAVFEAQGSVVRTLKAVGAPKTEINTAIETLNALKLEKTSIERSLIGGSDIREAFRQAVVNTLEWCLFYIPSFKIYRGVAGLFDYGPPGCATPLLDFSPLKWFLLLDFSHHATFQLSLCHVLKNRHIIVLPVHNFNFVNEI